MINQVTFKVFFERVKRRLSNGWPNIKFNITDNEIALYLYGCAATVITQTSDKSYSIDGIRSAPEGFITNYKFTGSQITYSNDNGLYTVTLTAPPVGLPLGYSIKSPYFSGGGAESYPLIAVHSFNRGYALKLPTPNFGVYYRVTGSSFEMETQGFDLINSGLNLNIPMLTARSATNNYSDVINMSDEAIEMVFDMVIKELTERMNTPTDMVNDGNKQYSQQP